MQDDIIIDLDKLNMTIDFNNINMDIDFSFLDRQRGYKQMRYNKYSNKKQQQTGQSLTANQKVKDIQN